MPMSAPLDAGPLAGAGCWTGAGAGRATGVEGRIAGASGRAGGAGVRRGAAESDMDRLTVATTDW